METASSIARAMQSFVIEGGRPLSGTVRASGNKNGALPILAACVLASDEVRLENVPRIRDVETMTELLADIGADVEWTGPNELRVDPGGVVKTDLDADLAREIRASFLLAGPLLARFGRVTVPPPGGDVIGRRRSTGPTRCVPTGCAASSGCSSTRRPSWGRRTRSWLQSSPTDRPAS